MPLIPPLPESALAQLSDELDVPAGTERLWLPPALALPQPSSAQNSSTPGAGAAVSSTKVPGQAVPPTQAPEPLGIVGKGPTPPSTQNSLRDLGQPPATLRDWAGPALKHLEWDQVEAEDCGEQLSLCGD